MIFSQITFYPGIPWILGRQFWEVGVKIPGDQLSKAVEVINGVTGWLTYFGYTCYVNIELCKSKLDEALNIAIETLSG